MFNGFLKQSTTDSVYLGPFVDDTDFKTVETGLTIANTAVLLGTGGALAAKNNTASAVHRGNGMYVATLNATDTATVGELMIACDITGALPVRHKYMVLEEAIYDAMFGSLAAGFDASGQVTTGTIATDAISAASVSAAAVSKMRAVRELVVDSGTVNTIVDAALTEVEDYWKGCRILITSGSAISQVREVMRFGATSNTLYLAPDLSASVTLGDTYEIIPAGDSMNSLVVFGIAAGTPTVTVTDSGLTETQDNKYVNRMLVPLTGPAKGEVAFIESYDGTTTVGELTHTTLQEAMATGNHFVIV